MLAITPTTYRIKLNNRVELLLQAYHACVLAVVRIQHKSLVTLTHD